MKPSQRLTLIKVRLFQSGSKAIPVFGSVRKKNSGARVIKLLRKNVKTLVVTVDDELGLMAVLDGRSEVKHFIGQFTDSTDRAGVAEFLCPHDVYQIDVGKMHQQQMECFRKR